MSFWPFLFDMERPKRYTDHHYSAQSGRIPRDDFGYSVPSFFANPIGHWKYASAAAGWCDGTSTVKCDENKYQINLDLQQFEPEELSVKTANGYIIIEAKHEEKPEIHGTVMRHFMRKYPLPDTCNVDTVHSRLSSDGVLTVTAPLVTGQASDERVVPIIQTGPVKTKPGKMQMDGGDGAPPVKIPVAKVELE